MYDLSSAARTMAARFVRIVVVMSVTMTPPVSAGLGWAPVSSAVISGYPCCMAGNLLVSSVVLRLEVLDLWLSAIFIVLPGARVVMLS